jgi:beta-lactamase class A
MSLVLDGVRPTARQPKQFAAAVGVILPAYESGKFVVGMDGIRRALPNPVVEPREMLASMQEGSGLTTIAAQSMPAFKLPSLDWRRPAVVLITGALVLLMTVGLTHSWTATRAADVAARSPSTHLALQNEDSARGTLAAAGVPQKMGLQQLLDNFVSANPGHFNIVVKDLTTGEYASENPDAQIASASLYKLFVAQRIYQRIDLGQLDYGSPAGGGSGDTVEQCLTVMINISDNTCGWALGDILGWGEQDQALSIEGYKQTTLATPQKTSAADVAMLFSRLYSGTLVSGNASERFLGLLKDQRVNNRLPQGLPNATVIAHKTGDLNDVVHDAGIVYGPKTNYLVVVMSGSWDDPGNAPPLFADLSQQLWRHFEQ